MPHISDAEFRRRTGCTDAQHEAFLHLHPDLKGRRGWRSGAVREFIEQGDDAEAPVITGLTAADRIPDGDAIWERMIQRQRGAEEKAGRRYHQEITLPGNSPCALAFLSDLHLGNASCDYAAALDDALTVRDTPGMYAALLGDYFDNWISVKLQHIQREQPVRLVEEHALLRKWLGIQEGKLLAVVAGNHDLRTYYAAGLDWLAELLQRTSCLYDQHEILVTLRLGVASWRLKLRHRWPGFSIYNQTHGLERDARFVDCDWDIGVAGHTHQGALIRQFAHAGRKRLALQLGSYEFDSTYARDLDCPKAPPHDRGCAAVVFYPDGRHLPVSCLKTAAEFLGYLRKS